MKWIVLFYQRQLAKLSNERVWRVRYFGLVSQFGWVTYAQAKQIMRNFPMGELEWKGDFHE